MAKICTKSNCFSSLYIGSGPDVYGAVVQEPRDSQLGMVGSGSPEVNEFGLLKQILYKEPNKNDRINGNIPSTHRKNPNFITVKLEHVLVAVGFCIGFGFVFCIAIVYYKVKPLQRFNILNNQTGNFLRLSDTFLLLFSCLRVKNF